MKRDISYGIVPVRMVEGMKQVLIIQQLAGHWAFPKGHADPGESAKAAAERELFEETGLSVVHYLTEHTFSESFYFTFQGHVIHKTVHYYLASVTGEVFIQECEIRASQWLTIEEAQEKVTFKEARRICQEVKSFLSDFE